MLVAFGLAAVLAAQNVEPPIEVQTCSTGVERSDMLVKTSGDYQISFIDRDPRQVDDIHFAIRLGSRRIFIHDVGKFASGVLVTHRFPNRGGEIVLVGAPTIGCEVLSVHFTDGSEWTEP